MQFEFLANRLDAKPVIGRWYHREWGLRLQGETEQQSIDRLNEYLHIDRLPFILLATEGTALLGAVQLKYREMADLYPDKEHWLGGVYVAPDHRNRGIGSLMAEEIAARAPEYGVKTLYLQTEQLDGGLYRRLGWQPIESVDNHGTQVLVMERSVGA